MNKKILAMFAAGCLVLSGILVPCLAVSSAMAASMEIPNDSMFSEQWALNNTGQTIKGVKGRDNTDMDVLEAWDFIETHFQSDSLFEPVVAVLDSGINYYHQDLQGRILTQGSKVIGYDFVNNDSDPLDDNGHGTIISGIIAASKNNQKGIAGISDKVKIMPVKVLDKDGSGSIENLKKGIVFAADNGADIINMSLVGPYDVSVSDAISYAYSKNVIVVCAAGSENIELGSQQLRSPVSNESAGKNWIIGVSSVANTATRADNSNYGSGIDVSAPGGSIISSYNTSDWSYVYASGTSLAAANVSGIAALIKSCYPNLSNAQISEAIIKSAKPVSGLSGMGSGIASAYNAISYAAVNFVGNTQQNPSNLIEGSLVKLKDNATVYYIQDGKKRGISRKEIFEARGFSWDDIEILNTQEELDYVPTGRLLGFPKGYLVRGSNQTVFLIEDNEIARPFSTAEAFLGMGLKWEDVHNVTDSEIERSYTIGEAII